MRLRRRHLAAKHCGLEHNRCHRYQTRNYRFRCAVARCGFVSR